jgi:hypothetical protein
MNDSASEQASILARHWRQARASRFDVRRFDGLAKLVVSVERRALERRLAFVRWASEQWAQSCPRLDRAA